MDTFKRLWISAVCGFGAGLLLAIFTRVDPLFVLIALVVIGVSAWFITGIKKADGSFKPPKLPKW